MAQHNPIGATVDSSGIAKIPESLLTAIIGSAVSGVGKTVDPQALSAAVTSAQQAQAEALGMVLTGALTARAQQERLRALCAPLDPRAPHQSGD